MLVNFHDFLTFSNLEKNASWLFKIKDVVNKLGLKNNKYIKASI